MVSKIKEFMDKYSFEALVIVCIVAGLVILALNDKISGESALSVFFAILGYVFGRTVKEMKSRC